MGALASGGQESGTVRWKAVKRLGSRLYGGLEAVELVEDRGVRGETQSQLPGIDRR